MSFLIDINESIQKETIIRIKTNENKNFIIFKALDSANKGIKGVSFFYKKKKLGITDKKGLLKVVRAELPKKGRVKASVGIYSAVADF